MRAKSELAADDEAVEELVVAVVAALLDALHAARVADHERAAVLVVALGLDVDHGDAGAAGLMGVDDGVQVHVEDDVGTHEHDVGLGGALEQRLVGDDVAQQEAHAGLGGAVGVARQGEQAAALAVEAPVLAVAHVVDDGTVVARHHEADGPDARVGHVGQREVDQAVAPHERHGGDRAAGEQLALLDRGVVGCDVTDGLVVDHRIIPPSR